MSPIGVDIGGTFTDLVSVDEDGGVETGKIPSTPSNPSKGAIVPPNPSVLSAAGLLTTDLGTTSCTHSSARSRPPLATRSTN